MTNKLTDLELCKSVAEIEGLKHWVHGNGQLYANHNGGTYDEEYNPLTNKALLFDLMVKHGVNIEHDLNGCGEAVVWRRTQSGAIGALARCKFCDSNGVPRAILECIARENK